MCDHVLDKNVVALLLDVEDSPGAGGHVILSERKGLSSTFCNSSKVSYPLLKKVQERNRNLNFTLYQLISI